MKFIPCCRCGKKIYDGEQAVRRRGFTGFYCSYRCLVLDTKIGYEDFVTDELVEEDKESSGYGRINGICLE